MHSLKQAARRLKKETYAVYLASTDQRVPWYARILAGLTVAYAFSPIDLIPDFIPVIGYLDDLIIVPLGIYLALRLIPPHVIADSQQKAGLWLEQHKSRPTNYFAAVLILLVWIALAYWAWTWWTETK